jgi:hypothetical protein
MLTVVGRLDAVPESDLAETGRLLGRVRGALIHHGGDETPERTALLRQGIAANEVPPVVVRVGTERQAMTRAIKMLRPDELVYVLADRPAGVLRAVERATIRLGGA